MLLLPYKNWCVHRTNQRTRTFHFLGDKRSIKNKFLNSFQVFTDCCNNTNAAKAKTAGIKTVCNKIRQKVPALIIFGFLTNRNGYHRSIGQKGP